MSIGPRRPAPRQRHDVLTMAAPRGENLDICAGRIQDAHGYASAAVPCQVDVPHRDACRTPGGLQNGFLERPDRDVGRWGPRPGPPQPGLLAVIENLAQQPVREGTSLLEVDT